MCRTNMRQRSLTKLTDENIMRGLATIITSANGDKKSLWLRHTVKHGRMKARNIPKVTMNSAQCRSAHKLSTIIKVSEELLNDSAFNLETYISSEFARRMGAAESLRLSTVTVQASLRESSTQPKSASHLRRQMQSQQTRLSTYITASEHRTEKECCFSCK